MERVDHPRNAIQNLIASRFELGDARARSRQFSLEVGALSFEIGDALPRREWFALAEARWQRGAIGPTGFFL